MILFLIFMNKLGNNNNFGNKENNHVFMNFVDVIS